MWFCRHLEWGAPLRVHAWMAAGGYNEEALRVAKVSGRHSKVVDICLHHVAGSTGGAEALAYITTLGRAEQEALLVQHGKALVSKFKLEMQARPPTT